LLAEVELGLRRKLAAILKIDRNNLYKQPSQPDKDDELKGQIQAVMKRHQHYGYRRVAIELKISKNRAQRVMHKFDLHPRPSPHSRNYKRHKGASPAPPNLIKELNLAALYPGHIWACDFTFVWCMGRFYYVATVIDLYPREIVGWGLSTRHDTKLILSAMYDALSSHKAPIYLHFDRGSEYLSAAHLNLCDSLEIRPSTSQKGSPWQNGFQERFYGSFKTELGPLSHIENEGELYELVALTLNYYNTERIHTKLKTNPRQFRQEYNNQLKPQTLSKTGVRDKVLKISGS
jgi:putative transposase